MGKETAGLTDNGSYTDDDEVCALIFITVPLYQKFLDAIFHYIVYIVCFEWLCAIFDQHILSPIGNIILKVCFRTVTYFFCSEPS